MSKFLFFDFRCLTCDHIFEDFVKLDAKPTCPKCSNETKRLISAPRISLSGKDPDFPRAYAKWEKTRRNKAAVDAKFYNRHGADKMHHSYGS